MTLQHDLGKEEYSLMENTMNVSLPLIMESYGGSTNSNNHVRPYKMQG